MMSIDTAEAAAALNVKIKSNEVRLAAYKNAPHFLIQPMSERGSILSSSNGVETKTTWTAEALGEAIIEALTARIEKQREQLRALGFEPNAPCVVVVDNTDPHRTLKDRLAWEKLNRLT